MAIATPGNQKINPGSISINDLSLGCGLMKSKMPVISRIHVAAANEPANHPIRRGNKDFFIIAERPRSGIPTCFWHDLLRKQEA